MIFTIYPQNMNVISGIVSSRSTLLYTFSDPIAENIDLLIDKTVDLRRGDFNFIKINE